MTIELTPMIAARLEELAREHDETPQRVALKVLAVEIFSDEELDAVLDEVDVVWWETEKAGYDPSQNIPFEQAKAALDAQNRGELERVA